MSLTQFVKRPEVLAKIKALRPKPPRGIDAPLRVPLRTKRWMLLGTAFDYLLRFELQRRAPHAITRRWAAEDAPGRMWQPDNFDYLSMDPHETAPEEAEEVAKQQARRASDVVERAKAADAAYLKAEGPGRSTQAELAAHAIRLGKLEEFYRSRQFDPTFEEADPEDVEELLDLLSVVPFEALLHDKVLFLNPEFGEATRLVGGADADLIAGDALIEFKTTTAGEAKPEHVDQLLGYFLLARHRRRAEPTFPEVKRFAIYFTRHGYLWDRDAALWTGHPDFPEVERWFFEHAKDVYCRP
jgi:hypothetical protein